MTVHHTWCIVHAALQTQNLWDSKTHLLLRVTDTKLSPYTFLTSFFEHELEPFAVDLGAAP